MTDDAEREIDRRDRELPTGHGRDAERRDGGDSGDRGRGAHDRRALDELAVRVQPGATWDDLVLPDRELQQLRRLCAEVRTAAVADGRGVDARVGPAPGTVALLVDDDPGARRAAAEAVATELGVDLYRVDLSAILSRYIGETERNLRAVFDAAERTDAVLLFDEADALFGRRTDVKDSHDRYANIEIDDLLERLEARPGLTLLGSNVKSSIDPAFLRRLRFVIEVPHLDG